jgi:hypothetical protein
LKAVAFENLDCAVGRTARPIEGNGLVLVYSLVRSKLKSVSTKFMKQRKYLIGGICAATLLTYIPLIAQTSPKKSASPLASLETTTAVSPAKQSARPIPFHGMVSAVDRKAKTFTISGKEKSRAFKVTDKTVVTKGANAATMKDIVENEEVSGSYWKNADSSLEAKTVKLGPMSSAKSGEKTEKSKAAALPAGSPSTSPKKR